MSKKDHNSVKILQMISKFDLDPYFKMLYPSVTLNEIDASLKKLSIKNQKCDAIANEDGDIVPMCLPCFAGDIR